jgi:hypothetical protein
MFSAAFEIFHGHTDAWGTFTGHCASLCVCVCARLEMNHGIALNYYMEYDFGEGGGGGGDLVGVFVR